MLARMCLLEKIPQAFDAYAPPRGINVAWYWDFSGKQNDNQVIAFFTGLEICLDEKQIVKQGDLLAEVQNNRCFVYIKTIPQSQWAATIPNFNYQGEIVDIPKDHPNINPNWVPSREYKGEVDEAILNKLNEVNKAANMQMHDTDPTKVKKIKLKGEKELRRYEINYVTFVDKIRAES